jgi:predicted amidohydrolase YtcJ
VLKAQPSSSATRPRIEHAQVLSPQDIPRFASLGVIASMQPSHAVEDMAWAEERIGPERIKGAYAGAHSGAPAPAWHSIRICPAPTYNIFYGLHSAVTRTDRRGAPVGGWRKEEALTIEEAIRGWTIWAVCRFGEADLEPSPGKSPISRDDIDPFDGATSPARFDGTIV